MHWFSDQCKKWWPFKLIKKEQVVGPQQQIEMSVDDSKFYHRWSVVVTVQNYYILALSDYAVESSITRVPYDYNEL